MFLGGKLTDLIGEWLEEERLNAPNTALSSIPPGPPTRNAVEAKIVPAEASEQQHAVEVDKETVASNPPLAVEDPIRELNSRVAAVQPLINLGKSL